MYLTCLISKRFDDNPGADVGAQQIRGLQLISNEKPVGYLNDNRWTDINPATMPLRSLTGTA